MDYLARRPFCRWEMLSKPELPPRAQDQWKDVKKYLWNEELPLGNGLGYYSVRLGTKRIGDP